MQLIKDVLVLIFNLTDFYTIKNLRLACRKFNTLAKPLWEEFLFQNLYHKLEILCFFDIYIRMQDNVDIDIKELEQIIDWYNGSQYIVIRCRYDKFLIWLTEDRRESYEKNIHAKIRHLKQKDKLVYASNILTRLIKKGCKDIYFDRKHKVTII